MEKDQNISKHEIEENSPNNQRTSKLHMQFVIVQIQSPSPVRNDKLVTNQQIYLIHHQVIISMTAEGYMKLIATYPHHYSFMSLLLWSVTLILFLH